MEGADVFALLLGLVLLYLLICVVLGKCYRRVHAT